MNILYVEDDADDCQLFIDALHRVSGQNPIHCVIANDGDEALAKLIDFPQNPDVIFIDINMPKMDGKELVAEIRSNDRIRDIPIVVYSTTISAMDMQFFNRHQVFHFFNKPGDFDVLCDGLRSILQKLNKAVLLQ